MTEFNLSEKIKTEAQKQLGSHIKSLKQVEVVYPVKKPKFSLGETLAKKSKRLR